MFTLYIIGFILVGCISAYLFGIADETDIGSAIILGAILSVLWPIVLLGMPFVGLYFLGKKHSR